MIKRNFKSVSKACIESERKTQRKISLRTPSIHKLRIVICPSYVWLTEQPIKKAQILSVLVWKMPKKPVFWFLITPLRWNRGEGLKFSLIGNQMVWEESMLNKNYYFSAELYSSCLRSLKNNISLTEDYSLFFVIQSWIIAGMDRCGTQNLVSKFSAIYLGGNDL